MPKWLLIWWYYQGALTEVNHKLFGITISLAELRLFRDYRPLCGQVRGYYIVVDKASIRSCNHGNLANHLDQH